MPERPSTPAPVLTELGLNILLALGRGPLHGYGIILDIEERTGAESDLRSGTLYGALRRLQADGLIVPSDPPTDQLGADGRRRYFAITPQGLAAAAAEIRRLDALVRAAVDRRMVQPRSVG